MVPWVKRVTASAFPPEGVEHRTFLLVPVFWLIKIGVLQQSPKLFSFFLLAAHALTSPGTWCVCLYACMYVCMYACFCRIEGVDNNGATFFFSSLSHRPMSSLMD